MTKEEILAMDPSMQLGRLVATEVMEWQRDGDHWVTPEGFWFKAEGLDGWYPWRDIAAAWQVLEKLREEHWCIDIRIADACWIIMELLRTPPIRVVVNAGTPFEKLPEAICKAALLAKLEATG